MQEQSYADPWDVMLGFLLVLALLVRTPPIKATIQPTDATIPIYLAHPLLGAQLFRRFAAEHRVNGVP